MPIHWSEVQKRIVTDSVAVTLTKRYGETAAHLDATLPDLVNALRSLPPTTRAEVINEALGGSTTAQPGQFWLELFDGSPFDVGCPRADQVKFREIVRGLDRTNRYAGATSRPVSVLLHTLIAYEDAINTESGYQHFREYVLHHDDAEAIVSDLTHPVKALLRHLSGGRSGYDLVEERVQMVIWQALGLPPPDRTMRDLIKRCDLRARAVERMLFMPNTGDAEWDSLAGIEAPEALVSAAWRITRAGVAPVDVWLDRATNLALARGVTLP